MNAVGILGEKLPQDVPLLSTPQARCHSALRQTPEVFPNQDTNSIANANGALAKRNATACVIL